MWLALSFALSLPALQILTWWITFARGWEEKKMFTSHLQEAHFGSNAHLRNCNEGKTFSLSVHITKTARENHASYDLCDCHLVDPEKKQVYLGWVDMSRGSRLYSPEHSRLMGLFYDLSSSGGQSFCTESISGIPCLPPKPSKGLKATESPALMTCPHLPESTINSSATERDSHFLWPYLYLQAIPA